jgi:hypothetical protein
VIQVAILEAARQLYVGLFGWRQSGARVDQHSSWLGWSVSLPGSAAPPLDLPNRGTGPAALGSGCPTRRRSCRLAVLAWLSGSSLLKGLDSARAAAGGWAPRAQAQPPAHR